MVSIMKIEVPIDFSRWKVINIDLQYMYSHGKCRYCKHDPWNHNMTSINKSCRYGLNTCGTKPTEAIEIFVPQPTTIEACPCLEYVPGDNLAFLEWKLQRGR
jgi:hypothetical protein